MTYGVMSTPHRARTCNLRFRRPMLYPIELGVPDRSARQGIDPTWEFGRNPVHTARSVPAIAATGRNVADFSSGAEEQMENVPSPEHLSPRSAGHHPTYPTPFIRLPSRWFESGVTGHSSIAKSRPFMAEPLGPKNPPSLPPDPTTR